MSTRIPTAANVIEDAVNRFDGDLGTLELLLPIYGLRDSDNRRLLRCITC
jgi:hypothetical protein